MKILFPRNIEKWRIAWLTFYIGPVKITLLQLVWLAIGAAIMLGITNTMIKNGHERVVAVIAWLPFLLVAIIIAFFELAEMNLFQFGCKLLRTYVFDTPRKYQCNVQMDAQSSLFLKKRQFQEKKEEIVKKRFDDISEKTMENDLLSWLLW